MAGSGLQEVLELVYAKNAVGHTLSGKAVARAVRGHFLVDAALNILLLCNTFNIPLPVDTRVYAAVQMTDKPTGTGSNERFQPSLTSLQVQRSNRRTQSSLMTLQRSNRKIQLSLISLQVQRSTH